MKEAITRYGKDFPTQDGFECMVEILLKLRRMDLIFGEVPFVLRYDLKQGGTKMKVSRTVFKTVVLMVRSRLGN